MKEENTRKGKPIEGVLPFSSLLSLCLRVLIGGVLLYSGVSKALAPSAEFAAALAAYRILPMGVIPTVAWIWPWLELLVGSYVLFGYFTRLFAAVAAGLFLVFVIVLGSSLLRGIDPGSCGCFGMFLTLSVRKTLVLDSLLLALSLLLTFLARRPAPYSADNWIRS